MTLCKITKPMLAGKYDPTKAAFPYLATPKIDGIRFLMLDGQAVSRSLKPIRNKHIQAVLSSALPDGIDGELFAGNNFQDTTSAVMSIEGDPQFTAVIFDYVDPKQAVIAAYQHRISALLNLGLEKDGFTNFVSILRPKLVSTASELDEFEEKCLASGYEGVMLRDPYGTYKMGRSTVKENTLLKLKRFDDAEGVLIGVEEKLTNTNLAVKNNLGRTERSTAKNGMVRAGTTGALVIELADGRRIGVGSGLDDKLRAEIWAEQDKYLGKLVKFKYFAHGVKDLPRHPIFLGFRDPNDVT